MRLTRFLHPLAQPFDMVRRLHVFSQRPSSYADLNPGIAPLIEQFAKIPSIQTLASCQEHPARHRSPHDRSAHRRKKLCISSWSPPLSCCQIPATATRMHSIRARRICFLFLASCPKGSGFEQSGHSSALEAKRLLHILHGTTPINPSSFPAKNTKKIPFVILRGKF